MSITDNLPTICTFYPTIRPELKENFSDWQATLNAVIASFEGFISLEFLASSDQPSSWVIIQRFRNRECMDLWQNSKDYLDLVQELKKLTVKGAFEEKIESEANLKTGVTEVIITQIDPKNEEDYRKWSAKIHRIESKFPGFRGVYIQSPHQNKGSFWVTLLQFDTQAHLDHWLSSEERKEVLKEASHLTSSLETHRIASPYAGWFYSIPDKETIPSVWKQTLLVLLVIFPIVVLEMRYLAPHLTGLNRAFGIWISNAISASLIAFPGMPIAIFFLNWWILPKGKNKILISILGTFVVFFLYFVEILIFWNFI